MRLLHVAIGAVLAFTTAAWQRPAVRPFGFTAEGARRQAAFERRFLSLPSADRLRAVHGVLTEQPHLAGSARDRQLAEYVRDEFTRSGLDDVEITTHQVLLPWPVETSVEIVSPGGKWRASLREAPVPGDPATHISPAAAGIPYHAYSASGEVTASIVYAGAGNPQDYDLLEARGIDVRRKIVLVRYSTPYSYRGFKAFTAQQRGAAGILIYSDPADDGYGRGRVYPDGPWGPLSHIQRGGVSYDFLVPGDPLTPGWASTPDARRIPRAQATSLPSIVSAPLSHEDARVLLERMGGPDAPPRWRGGLPIRYRLGGGPLIVRLRVRTDDRIRPIWTVTGRLQGAAEPDRLVIVGNHRDAWVYGGVDPSGGTAALIELARTLGAMTRQGWQPARSILFASWDAEEFSLTSSTEWGEQHADRLQRDAIAYLNVDGGASGSRFAATAVPALNRLLTEVAQTVRDPALRIPIFAASRDRTASDTGSPASDAALIANRPGGGSDFTVFLNFLGIPIADLSFRGPYGVYHSLYDTHRWVDRIGDPGFRYHVALTQLWGLAAARLADAGVLPLDYEPYADRIDADARELAQSWASVPGGSSADLADVRRAAAELKGAAARFNSERARALAADDAGSMAGLNARLIAAERAFVDRAGLRGRPWFRHLVFAPRFSYAPEALPGIAEAIETHRRDRVQGEAARLAMAIRRAADVLSADRSE